MTNAKKSPTRPAQTSNREAAAETNRSERRRNRHNADVADWANATPELLHSAIQRITAKGCAIQFGCTRDGGSLVVRIVGDGEPYNEYIRPSEDLDVYLSSLAEDFH